MPVPTGLPGGVRGTIRVRTTPEKETDMAEHKGKAINTGIVNYGGTTRITSSAQGKGATVVNGKVTRGERVDTTQTSKKK